MLELKEGYGYTPTLIGVCNEHGAFLCGDTRMVTLKDDKAVFMEDCRKVFKVNDGLLYGAAGMFPVDAMLIEPLVGKKAERLNVVNMTAAVQDYLLEQKAVGNLRTCSYVLAGKDRGGKMCIACVRYDEEDDTIYTDRQYCTDKDVIWMSLPPAAALDEEKWRERLGLILEADNGVTLEDKLWEFIMELAAESKFTGGDVLYRAIVTEEKEAPGD